MKQSDLNFDDAIEHEDDAIEHETDWSWLDPYKEALWWLFYRIYFYKSWKKDWGPKGNNLFVCDALLSPHKFISTVIDWSLSYVFKQPKLNINAFDEWLHKEFGAYENEGLSMKTLLELKFDKDTARGIEALL